MFLDSPTFTYGIILLATALYFLNWLKEHKASEYPLISNVPALGPTAPLLSYWGAFRFMISCQEMLAEGHAKFGGSPFRIATRRYWHYIVSDPKLLDELRRAPDDEMSFAVAVSEALEFEYALGVAALKDTYHVPIIKTTLTRNLSYLYGAIYDEICNAFADCIPAKDEWIAMPAMDTVMQVVARTSARIFVGLPLCRNQEFLDISVNYTTDVVKTGLILNIVPVFLKPTANRLINRVDRTIDRTYALLSSTMEERRAMMEQCGDEWTDKPNDLLQWLMEAAEGVEREPRALAARLLMVCFAAIHTTSMSFTHALYHLAAHPEYMKPLREDVEAIVAEHGWSKDSLQKMRKVDSFLKECQRFQGIGIVFLERKVLKDYTFSDGTFIPKGSCVSTSKMATHDQREYYDDPCVFKPWRFSDMPDETGEGTKYQLANTSMKFLPFGVGKHACPGRYFAANELKTMMAHLVMTYDVRMEKPGEIPRVLRFGTTTSPNRTAKVLFRKRKD
ncbi:uncharacterized protein PHACADRAFT_128033 [Phanerochaete carnosa HHB-10118-sp]|uniref:Cytochrome P450 n=1 Tax=Phanerochaete carnosa (strain HHB-10118-sp) TaxID=650164 RepID=K5UQ72_PHACS|nr:uncharacterized protein PHACADRAFT_128033 [Phanerochaete carnosa HHB-10118-sp]EKM51971.1 hypothetical protein PHACADRAFT_128033 [Phanerochaete carnosa HHB-10118-sp]